MAALSITNTPKWCELVEYEQYDIAFALMKELRQTYFKHDHFTLAEVEDTFCSSSMHKKCQTHLLVSGSVGKEREDAFLELIRRVRLRHVSDLETNVQIRLQENDAIPHLWLEPLAKPCKRIRALLRWHLARTAMRCGMMRAILDRREQTRERIRCMLERSNSAIPIDFDDNAKCVDGKKAFGFNLTHHNDDDDDDDNNTVKHTRSSAEFAIKAMSSNTIVGETNVCNDSHGHDNNVIHSENAKSDKDETLVNGNNLEFIGTKQEDLSNVTETNLKTSHCNRTVEVIYKNDTEADVHLKRYLPFEEFSNALRETNIDVACVVNNIPTLLIAWSYRNVECINWLRDNMFNDKVQKIFEKHKGLKTRVATLVGADPWVKLLESFIKLPQGRVSEQQTIINGKLCLFPRVAKRAQIVLVNIDYDKDKAAEVYCTMQKWLKNWKSEQVYLLSLWAGCMGGTSEFARLFHIDTLPHFTITSPAKRNHINYTVERPCIVRCIEERYSSNSLYENCNRSSLHCNNKGSSLVHHDENTNSINIINNNSNSNENKESAMKIQQAPSINEEIRDMYWHSLSISDRIHLSTVISDLITSCHIPIYFSAHVSREYVLVNPYASNASKGLHVCTSSTAKMCGRAFVNDLLICKDAFVQLHSVQNFEFDVQVLKTPHECLITEYEPVTPLHSINNLHQVISCSHCNRRIKVQNESYYRCLHCTQCDGVVCNTCAAQPVPLHPEHHILLRVAAGTTSEHMTLLWGPSNVAPLPLFCGKLIMNAGNLHAGVYCNRCRFVIRGIRWKCAMCYEYDLCDICMKKSLTTEVTPQSAQADEFSQQAFDKPINFMTSTKAKKSSAPRANKVNEFNTTQLSIAGHHITHPMLQIRYATGEFADHMLRPTIINDLWSYEQETAH